MFLMGKPRVIYVYACHISWCLLLLVAFGDFLAPPLCFAVRPESSEKSTEEPCSSLDHCICLLLLLLLLLLLQGTQAFDSFAVMDPKLPPGRTGEAVNTFMCFHHQPANQPCRSPAHLRRCVGLPAISNALTSWRQALAAACTSAPLPLLLLYFLCPPSFSVVTLLLFVLLLPLPPLLLLRLPLATFICQSSHDQALTVPRVHSVRHWCS
jgi:hypothetical protein